MHSYFLFEDFKATYETSERILKRNHKQQTSKEKKNTTTVTLFSPKQKRDKFYLSAFKEIYLLKSIHFFPILH